MDWLFDDDAIPEQADLNHYEEEEVRSGTTSVVNRSS
jgi:hypothetical protein